MKQPYHRRRDLATAQQLLEEAIALADRDRATPTNDQALSDKLARTRALLTWHPPAVCYRVNPSA